MSSSPADAASQLNSGASTPALRSAAASSEVGAAGAVVVSGIARKERRTKALVKRLRAGDIAVIDAAPPISGRYPNRGPAILAAARVPLYTLVDPGGFDAVADGTLLRLHADGVLRQNGAAVGVAEEWSAGRIAAAGEQARGNLAAEIQRFADNTLSFVRAEAGTLLAPVGVAEIGGLPRMDGRHAVVVVRGEGYKQDLASIRGYIADERPVVIGVDGGADALLEQGVRPQVIIGDMDSVSDRALRCGARLIVHGYAGCDDAPGLARVRQLGLAAGVFRVPGTSEDAAMLLAYEKGASLIVAVGTHSNLEDFLDKGRAGMASTFLTRLKVGSRLVDARGVSKLHQPRLGVGGNLALFLSAAFVMVALLSVTPYGAVVLDSLQLWWRLTLVHFQHILWHLHRRG